MADRLELWMIWNKFKENTGDLNKRWDVSSYNPVRLLDDVCYESNSPRNKLSTADMEEHLKRYIHNIEAQRKPGQGGRIWVNMFPYDFKYDENGKYLSQEYNGPSWDEMTDGIKNNIFRVEKGLLYQGYSCSRLKHHDLNELRPRCILLSDDPSFPWPAFIRYRAWKRLTDDPELKDDINEVEKFMKGLDSWN